MHDEANEGGGGHSRASGLQALGGAENDTLYDGQGLARRWGGEGEVCLDASVHVW